MRKLPKRFAVPANGLSVADEPDDLKAARLLGAFRHIAQRNQFTLGITVGDAQYMVVRYQPMPAGPHSPTADLSGVDL